MHLHYQSKTKIGICKESNYIRFYSITLQPLFNDIQAHSFEVFDFGFPLHENSGQVTENTIPIFSINYKVRT